MEFKNRYDGKASGDAMRAKRRQDMYQKEHASADAFVKKQQAETAKYAGRTPELKEAAMHYDAYACNDGMHAQEFARGVTKGLDKEAFPVK